jgi:hypothetical protein
VAGFSRHVDGPDPEAAYWIGVFVMMIVSVMHLLAWLSTYSSQTQMTIRLAIVMAAWVAFGFAMRQLFLWDSRFAARCLTAAILPLLLAWCALTHWLSGRQLLRGEGE